MIAVTVVAGGSVRVVVRVLQVALVAALVAAVVYLVRGGADAGEKPFTGPNWGPEKVLGPDGIGRLKLGMTEEQANATGEVRVSADWKSGTKSTCNVLTFDDASVQFSRTHGLALVGAPPQVSTAEGIRAGAGLTEVLAAYPYPNHTELGSPAKQVQLAGYLTATVPGNPAAIYIFVFNAGGGTPSATAQVQIVYLSLRSQGDECTHAT
jgi:hypothetical protein